MFHRYRPFSGGSAKDIISKYMEKKEREVRKVEKCDAEELKEASRALVEYLRKKQTPMTTAIVTGAGVEILSTEIHVPFEEEWD